MKLSKGYIEAIQFIKLQGFSHFKIELEGNLNRRDSHEQLSHCNCSDGRLNCGACEGNGWITMDANKLNPYGYRVECGNCEGEGSRECHNCDGRGIRRTSADWSESKCKAFMLSHLPAKASRAINYAHFYDDGSVDSELTVTLPIESAHYSVDLIKAFLALGEAIGSGVDTDNAGLHLSVLPQSRYPCNHGLLDSTRMENFRAENTKLLPALYFLAASAARTRGLGYRMPRVSKNDKYSAIFTHGDSAIEYRIFDPCYNKPELVLDFIQIISKTLIFYSDSKALDEATSQKIIESFGMQNDRYSLLDHYAEHDQLEALEKTIAFLKPANKSFTTLKSERGVTGLTKSYVKTLEQKELARFQSEYAEYANNWRHQFERQFDSWLRNRMEAYDAGWIRRSPMSNTRAENLAEFSQDRAQLATGDPSYSLYASTGPVDFKEWHRISVGRRKRVLKEYINN